MAKCPPGCQCGRHRKTELVAALPGAGPELRDAARERALRVVATALRAHYGRGSQEDVPEALIVLRALGRADFRMISKSIVDAYQHNVGPTPNCGHCVQLQAELDRARSALKRQEDKRWQAEDALEGLRQRLEKLTDSVKWERFDSQDRGSGGPTIGPHISGSRSGARGHQPDIRPTPEHAHIGPGDA